MKRLKLPEEQYFVEGALLWKRIAAFIMDILIINLIVLFPFRRLLQHIIPKEYNFTEAYKFLSTSTKYTGYIKYVSILISISIILYFLMMEKKMGQTIGKKLMKIYIVSDNNSLNTWQLLVRNLVFIPIFPFIALWIFDPLFMFFTKSHQRLCEILSKTRVVEKFSVKD